jgi:hypothetical protein
MRRCNQFPFLFEMRCIKSEVCAGAFMDPRPADSEHDPQKHGPAKAGLDAGFTKRSCSNKREEPRSDPIRTDKALAASTFMRQWDDMKELIRSNDLVLLSYIEALLKEANIPHEMADEHMSAVVGSIDASQRRIMVSDEDWASAREIVDAAQDERSPADDG